MTGTKPRMLRMSITEDDSKVLGKSPVRFCRNSDKFTTKKYKTHNSAWTPVVHKPSNEQIFKERRELISHWFDLWSDNQRKRFLDVILKKCGKSQLFFAHNWFQHNNVCTLCPNDAMRVAMKARAIIERVDPTTVLPRFLTLYIFSMLDPKTLSRAARVSWTWKFMTEQDSVWQPKAIKHGWYLPYRLSTTEYGAWKRHYLQCVQDLDIVTSKVWPMMDDPESCDTDAMYSTLTEAARLAALQDRMATDAGIRIKPGRISSEAAKEILDARFPWQGPQKSATDVADAAKALLYGFNPNDPKVETTQQIYHNKFGQLRSRSARISRTEPILLGLNARERKNRHRGVKAASLDFGNYKKTLSDMSLARYQRALEKSLNELKAMPWKPPPTHSRPGVSSSTDYQNTGSLVVSRRQVKIDNPRIIFISSRIPAAELLHDAVLNDVYPIMYEFEGTTAENLIDRLGKILNGSAASSIGLVAHSTQPGELCLLYDTSVTLDCLDDSKIMWFFESLANHTKPVSEGGHVDLFVPLAASESGTEILMQLNILTGMKFTAPTGISGHYNLWNCEWFGCQKAPSLDYLESSKALLWASAAETVTEAISHTKNELQPYFDQTRSDLLNQITGQMVTDAMALGNIRGLSKVAPLITETLSKLGTQKNIEPLEFVAQYLASKCQAPQTTKLDELTDDEEEKQDKSKSPRHSKEPQTSYTDTQSVTFLTTGKSVISSSAFTARRTGVFNSTLTAEPRMEYSDHPDRRFVVAKEILSTEMVYSQDMEVLKKVFVLPLKRSIESNRAIIASSTVQLLFSDAMILYEMSEPLLAELRLRVREWSAEQCIGDVFIKFATKLKAFMNYINNYPTILLTLDTQVETNPGFRAFLKRQERTPITKMRGLNEMYLLPIQRITDYVRLLNWLKVNTPRDHPDREDLSNAISYVKEVDTVIRQTRSRIRRDRKLLTIGRMIENCPKLLEGNRIFLTKQDFALVVAKDASLPHDNRLYTHTEDIGLFLFNDALIMTHLVTEHHAFERSASKTYIYRDCMTLVGLKVKDVPNTRYLRNAFKLKFMDCEWILSTECHDFKFEFTNTLEHAIKTAIEDHHK